MPVVAVLLPAQTLAARGDLDYWSAPGITDSSLAKLTKASALTSTLRPAAAPTAVAYAFNSSLAETGSSRYVSTNVDLAIGEELTAVTYITWPKIDTANGTITVDVPSTATTALMQALLARILADASTNLLLPDAAAIAVTLVDANGDGIRDRMVVSLGRVLGATAAAAGTNRTFGLRFDSRLLANAAAATSQAVSTLVSVISQDRSNTSITSLTQSPAYTIDVVEPRLSLTMAASPTLVSSARRLIHQCDANAGPRQRH